MYKFAEPRLPTQSCGKSLGVLRWEDIMVPRERLTLRLMLGWFTSLSVSLCAFSLIMPPQVVTLATSDFSESECPPEEGRKTSEGEIVVSSSSRRRRCVDHQGHRLYRVPATDRCPKIASFARPVSAIVGHQLANGIAAPRLI